jgi:hypothetical protein
VDFGPGAPPPVSAGWQVLVQKTLAKVGIRNLSPHLRNSAILWTTKSIAKLQIKKSCGTVIADLQNLTSAIPHFSVVPCQSATFLSLFLSSGWISKATTVKIFLESSVSLETELALKGQ